MDRYIFLSDKENLTEDEENELEDLERKNEFETMLSIRAWANGGM
jgi:hypothetical protein